MKTTKELVENLQKILGDNLRSVVLYGSASSQDQSQRLSDINILAITNSLETPVLKTLAPLVRQWEKAGHPAPQFFTESSLRRSTDVFPLEFLDIQGNHQLVYGQDIFLGLEINNKNLQHQLEFELRSKLLQMRQRYFQLEATPGKVLEMMGKALSSFAALSKGVLMLNKRTVPLQKKMIWKELSELVSFDEAAFIMIWDFRNGIPLPKDTTTDILFSRFTKSIEAVIDFVDRHH